MAAALCTVLPLPHSPGPWPQAPVGGRVPGWQNHPGSWSDRDSIVTLRSHCCLWKGCSNPISSAFHGCQLFAGEGGRCLKPELLCGPSSHMCSSIHHVVLDPFVGWPGPYQWHLAPPPSCPTFPSILGYSRPGLGCISQVPWEEERRRGGVGRGMGPLRFHRERLN